MISRQQLRDARGVTAIEFALIAPILLGMIFGVAQLGILFFASSGLKFAVAEGARIANTHPRPSITQVRAHVLKKRFGVSPSQFKNLLIVQGTSESADYYEISVSYVVPVDFFLIDVPPITLQEKRRTYIYPLPVA
jgi:hypothetical protein